MLNNGVSVSGFGKGTGVVAAFQKMVDAAHKKMADELAERRWMERKRREALDETDEEIKAEYQASGERMIGEYAEDMPAYVDAVLDEAYETDKKPTTSAKERLRLAEAAVKYLEERHRELTAKYKGQPNSVKTLKNIKGDLDRVRALRRSLYQQVNQKPKGSLRQDMAAAAASAVVPVSETNETGGNQVRGDQRWRRNAIAPRYREHGSGAVPGRRRPVRRRRERHRITIDK